MLVQYCCRHVKVFIEDLEKMYGDDEFMDEDILEILHDNSFQGKEIQIDCIDIQENLQQLLMSSLAEIDINQNSDLTSHTSFFEIDENFQHSCQFLCDQ